MSEEEEEGTRILPISPISLHEEILETHVYADLGQVYYWSQHWDPDFYVALAYAGFISISYEHPEIGAVLIPEMQREYAVLDWPDLHRSRQLRRLLRSGRLEREAIELRVTPDVDEVVERLLAYHAPETWLTVPYRELLENLPRTGHRVGGFSLHAIELRAREDRRLVAGELGYSLGSTYTSLSGFCTRPDRSWRHFGTLQQVLLAERLAASGYAFWNMGHPDPAYKIALGARILPRQTFLRRWIRARDVAVPHPLV
ncbi:MAG: GNAT family N-acetyltransferase [Spirochaetaceae bacterium]|nr:GNAT family N-acetyltransferase [Myxococcales bacterium]MCB9722588.1 GNAT family N-acetyltransferase [Spirochaetaceae bacterium]